MVNNDQNNLDFTKLLLNCHLFAEIESQSLTKILACLNSQIKTYPKGEFVWTVGKNVATIGIVLEGVVQIEKGDAQGNTAILTQLGKGELFGETFVCAGLKASPVNVVGITATKIMFIDYLKIITTCSNTCVFHTKLVENMLKLIAKKNLLLNEKIDCISKRSLREKLKAYLKTQQQKAGSNSFVVPFSRVQLADYLCVDRSAMCRELGKMHKEGLLEFKGNAFKLKQTL